MTGLVIEDITSETASSGYASASQGSANTAASQASAAAGSANVAGQQAANALTYQNNAYSYSQNAQGYASQASGSASSALSYMSLASSFGSQALNKDAFFADPTWTGGVPPGWNMWANDNGVGYGITPGVPGAYGPHPFYCARQGNSGIRADVSNIPAGWYVLECDVQRGDAGTVWAGAGMHINFNNGTSYNKHFDGNPDTSGLVYGGAGYDRRSWSWLINTPSQCSPSFYCMSGWSGFDNGYYLSPGSFYWHKALLRPASQSEIDAKAALTQATANASRIEDVNNTLSNAVGSLATRTTTVESRALAGGNLLKNSTFVTTDGWALWTNGRNIDGSGINGPNDSWHPVSENALWMHQAGNDGTGGAGSGGEWVASRVAVNAGQIYQFYAWIAAHRAQVEMDVQWFDGSGNNVGGTNYTGGMSVATGGTDTNNWSQVGFKTVTAPSGATQAEFHITKWNTQAGQGDSYMWIWRPYIGLARSGQTEWNPYAPGSGSAVQSSILARVTTAEGTLATVDGRTQAYATKTAVAGLASAFITMMAKDDNGNYTSDVSIGASNFSLYAPNQGGWTQVLNVSNGYARFNGRLSADSIDTGQLNSGRLEVASRSFSLQDCTFQTHDNYVSWSGGYVFYTDSNGNKTGNGINGGSTGMLNGNYAYIYWNVGSDHFDVGDWPTATASGRIHIATYQGGNSITKQYGGTIIDGSNITTGSMDAQVIRALTITTDRLVDNSVTQWGIMHSPNVFYGDSGSGTTTGGGTGGGTGTGGGGGGNCVAETSFMPLGGIAAGVRGGDEIVMLDRDSDTGHHVERVVAVKRSLEPCARIVTESGISLVCSLSTPITTRAGRTVALNHALLVEVPVLDNKGFRWERIVGIALVGDKWVSNIGANDGTYAAGEQADRYIFTHNKQVDPDQ